ncbi:hypothetical protein Pen01_20320 [Phytomonospora endophytica]|nr:hypothetical protein Pen01_20320 [Phytomonospora endophytica]
MAIAVAATAVRALSRNPSATRADDRRGRDGRAAARVRTAVTSVATLALAAPPSQAARGRARPEPPRSRTTSRPQTFDQGPA